MKTVLIVLGLMMSLSSIAGVKECKKEINSLYATKFSDAMANQPRPNYDLSASEAQERLSKVEKEVAPYTALRDAGLKICEVLGN